MIANNIYSPYDTIQIKNDFNDGERICYVTFVLDKSGSMIGRQSIVFSAVHKTLKALVEKTNEDIEYRVRIVYFNDEVSWLNDTYLPPEQLLELFTADTYQCGGGTHLGKIVSFTDSLFTRTSELMSSKHKGDPKTCTLFITDFVGTDNEVARNNAINRIATNRLFNDYNTTLCVFCGPESKKNDAVALCGCEDNLIALEDKDFGALLTPVLLGSTLTLTDGTHTGNQNQTPSEMADSMKQRNETGEQGAAEMSDNEMAAELARLLGSA